MAMRAGVAEVTITPALGSSLSGYGGRAGRADAIHDDLRATALVLEAAGTRVALLTCDLVGLPVPLARKWRDYWSERTGIAADHILVSCSHTHAGPPTGMLDDSVDTTGERERIYLGHLEHALSGALEVAASRLHPVRLQLGEGRIRVQRNRRDRLPGPHGPVDDALGVLCLDQVDDSGAPGALLAMVVQYACHPVVLRQHNLGVSADYVGWVRRAVTGATGAPCLFLQGACGDLVPDLPRLGTPGAPDGISPDVADQLEVARRIGGMVGAAAVATLASVTPMALAPEPRAGAVQCAFDAALARAGEDGEGRTGEPGALPFEVPCLRLGDLAIVGLPVEPLCAVGLSIRNLGRTLASGGQAGPSAVWCAGYANGCYGYLPPEQEYPRGGYEVASAHRYYRQPAAFAPETAARAVAAAAGGLAALWSAPGGE